MQFLVMEGNRRTYYAVEVPAELPAEEDGAQDEFRRKVVANLDLQIPNLLTGAGLEKGTDRSNLYKDNRWLQRCRFITGLPTGFVPQNAGLLEIPKPGSDDDAVLVVIWR